MWKILGGHHEIAAKFLKYLKDFLSKCVCNQIIKDELDQCKVKLCKNYTNILHTKVGSGFGTGSETTFSDQDPYPT
jgi:hypothetical protein